MVVSGKKKFLVVAGILFIPAILLLLFSKSQGVFMGLPYYGPKTVDASGDTVYFQLPDFHYQDYKQRTVKLSDYEGKILLLEYYAGTPNLLRAYKQFKDEADIKFLSMTLNPKMNTAFAQQFFIDEREHVMRGEVQMDTTWNFVVVPDSVLVRDAMAFFNGAEADTYEEVEELIKQDITLLIDKDRHVRGVFYSGLEDQVSRLMQDVRMLRKHMDYIKIKGNEK